MWILAGRAGARPQYVRSIGPRALPTDFRAEGMIGVQHAIEDVNGVTYRDADTEIRSKYGVYAT